MYKMVYISVEKWNKAEVSVIRVHENDNVNKTLLKLLCISDIAKRWGDKNLYDLIDKKIKRKYEVKNMNDLTKQQIRKYKIDRARLFKGNKHSMHVHSIVKWSDPGHFLKAQGKFSFSFLCILFLQISDT